MSTDQLEAAPPLDADALATRLLGTKRTRLGGLHIDHARRVAAAAGDLDPSVRAVALLHDVVEQSGISVEELRELTGDAWITDMVGVLTKLDGESEQKYLQRCAADPVALRIKRLDITDKLITDDVHVPADEAERLRAEARQRLRTLDALVEHHPVPGGARSPARTRASGRSDRKGGPTVTDTEPRPAAEDASSERRQQPAPGLTPEQLGEVLSLLKGADTVELKLSVPDANRRSTTTALAMDPLAAQIRQVVFFDTPDLALNRHGVVVRARRVQGREADSVVKLRPVVPDELPASLRRSPMFGVEVDAMPGGFVCSASMKAKHDDAKVKAVLDGVRATRKIFSKEQRAFYAQHAPAGLEIDALVKLGPIMVLKLKFDAPGFRHRLVAELWNYPDGSRLLELSTKCAPQDAFTVAAEAKAYLAGRGVDLLAEQQTKTRTALDFFAAELSPSAASGPVGGGS